ncbi:unnamed protein product, partial [Ectocarpus sp. 13 AM-2016]
PWVLDRFRKRSPTRVMPTADALTISPLEYSTGGWNGSALCSVTRVAVAAVQHQYCCSAEKLKTAFLTTTPYNSSSSTSSVKASGEAVVVHSTLVVFPSSS